MSLAEFVAAYNETLASTPEPPSGLRGDGIIMALFERGTRAHASVEVTVNILRDILGWQGAIQLWHVGDAPKLCKNMQVEFINAADMVQRFPGRIRSWCLKSYAIEHSGLARVMWLDWDAYLCKNPKPLFRELNDVDFYYWSNGRHWDGLVNRQVVESITTNPTPHSIQGGCYLLNCASPGGWKFLQLQRIFDTHERDTWSSNYDQDGWLIACAANAGKFYNNDRNPWVWPAWVSYYKDPSASISTSTIEDRQATCQACQHMGNGHCLLLDDNHSTWYNCEQSRRSRYNARLATASSTCSQWPTTDDVPYVVHRCGEKLWGDKLAKFTGQMPLDKVVERLYVRAMGDNYERLKARPVAASAPGGETQRERIDRIRRERGKVKA